MECQKVLQQVPQQANASSLDQPGNNNVATRNNIGCTTIYNCNIPLGCQPNSPEINRMQSEDEVSKLKSALQCFYKKTIVPCVPWIARGESYVMDKYYIEVDLELNSKKRDTQDEDRFTLEKMFEPKNEEEKEIPKRILVESQPGYGKTTLAMKLIYDWANNREYLKQFELAFLIQLRDMKCEHLKDEIEEICRQVKEHAVDLNEIDHEKILLVLDGFDRITQTSRKNVIEVLYQLEFRETTVFLTSRPGIFPLENKEMQKLIRKHVQIRRTFHDRKVVVRGIGVENRIAFLTNFCPQDDPADVIDRIAGLPEKREEMFQSPLLLLLICHFTKLGIAVDTTLTNLYKSFLDNIVKINVMTDDELSIDMFNAPDRMSRRYHEMVEKFGDLCLTKLMDKVSIFESCTSTKEIFKLGLLKVHNSTETFDKREHFECFHLSFMEFFIAYSTWRKFETGQIGEESHTELFEQMRVVIKDTWETTLVGLFLSGLLQEKAIKLFELLKSVGFDFRSRSNVGNYFWKMVAQLNGNEKLARSIAQFIYWEIHEINDKLLNDFFQSKFYSDIIRNGIELSTVKTIRIPEMIFCNLPVNVTVDKLELKLRNDESKNKCVNYVSDIQCQRLKCKIVNASNLSFAKETFSLFSSIVANDNKHLSILKSPSAYTAFLNSITIGSLKEINFSMVWANISGRFQNETLKILSVLLAENRLCTLHLKIFEKLNDDLQRMVTCAVESSSSLCELNLINCSDESIGLDCHQFRRKDWKRFFLTNCHWYCGQLNQSLPCADCQRMIDGTDDSKYNYYNCNFVNVDCDWLNNKPSVTLELL